MADGALAFGPFLLDPVARLAAAARAQRSRSDSAPLAVLAALAEAPGRTVTKADLLARAWPGAVVEEGNLTVQIAALRKALGRPPTGRTGS